MCFISLPFLLGIPNSYYFQLFNRPYHTVAGGAVTVESWVLASHVVALAFLVGQNLSGTSSVQTQSLSKETLIGSHQTCPQVGFQLHFRRV